MREGRHLLVIPDGNRRHARREYLSACMQKSLDAFRGSVAHLDESDRESLERRLARYLETGNDSFWEYARDLLDEPTVKLPEEFLRESYRASGKLIDELLRWALADEATSELTLYAAQAGNLLRADSEVASFLSAGADYAKRWANDREISSRCTFQMVGDRALFERKQEAAGLAETVTDFLEQTARLEKAGRGDELHVNILAPYDFLWEINQAIVNGRFCPDRLVVREAVDFVFRSGSFGRAALSGAIPCQTAFSKICLSPVYFPDCTVDQIERAIRAGGAPRFVSGL